MKNTVTVLLCNTEHMTFQMSTNFSQLCMQYLLLSAQMCIITKSVNWVKLTEPATHNQQYYANSHKIFNY